MEKDDKSSTEERKVSPIRVVNLASLQNIKIVNKEMPIRQSRRKSVHQVRSNSDEQIVFIETQNELSNGDSSPTSTIASSSNSAIAPRRSLPIATTKSSSKKKSQEARPNENLMKRVALLRVCAEYMLKELQIDNVIFGENQSLEMLTSQYLRSMKRKRSCLKSHQ